MSNETLTSGQSTDIDGTTLVKVSNNTATAGSVKVKCPNVDAVTYAVPANGSKNIQIPVGTSRFTNTGTPDLDLSW
ncbi:hypothetical protein [Pyxidicoccus trucidator]|uniref:hypothetical protein n=1 Tax=Pyxidicoccus trucidator TaxID=2709662 RepID=UPI0013D9B48C|nr:hypothetical protein [Pyxidicoccus trucidator]